jgi:Flp pilus assembly protein TadD
LLARYHLAQARFAFALDRADVAVEEVQRGARLCHDDPRSINNLATLCARNGVLDLADLLWSEALELDPGYELARRNLQHLRAGAGASR